MSVRKLTTWIPVTDEMVVDGAMGTEDDQRAAAARIDARRADLRAYWLALPWHVRARRTLSPRIAEVRHRLAHARRALVGIDCERDW